MRLSDRRAVNLAILTSAALLLTHAIALFLHEYSHSFAAWILGFKSDPLALHYGDLNLPNILLQQEINENVAYAPIFGSGHGLAAALIAFAGPGFGNGVLYLVLALVLRRRLSRLKDSSLLFLLLLALMASGNLWSYAPVRTITTHADMALIARGIGISSLTLFPFVVAPSLWAAWDFFARLMPTVLARIWGDEMLPRTFFTAIACFIFFGFYGCPALVGDYGNVSAVISILSLFLGFPLVLMLTLSRLRTGQPSTDITATR